MVVAAAFKYFVSRAPFRPRQRHGQRQGQPAPSKAQAELLSAVDAASEWDDAAFTQSLDASFARAAEHVGTFINDRRIGNADRLMVYALYKQATAGACCSRKPRLIDGMTKHAKWDAWMVRLQGSADFGGIGWERRFSRAQRATNTLSELVSPPPLQSTFSFSFSSSPGYLVACVDTSG